MNEIYYCEHFGNGCEFETHTRPNRDAGYETLCPYCAGEIITREELDAKSTIKKMNEYKLNSCWRERRIFGETMTDALIREKALRESDTYAGGVIAKKGEIRTIVRVLHERESDQSIDDKTFGRHHCRIVAEFDDGKIREVWAEWRESDSFIVPTTSIVDPRD